MSKELTVPIPARLKNVSKNGHVAGVEDIYDDELQKTQKEINAETEDNIAAEVERATGVEELLQSEVNALSSQNYVSVDSYSELPELGSVDTVYRVGSWDGTQVDPTKYAEYAWNNTGIDQGEYKLLDVKDYGIDDEPTAGSENLVKSSGVQNELALGAVYDVSAKNPTAGPNNDGKFESLSALLSDANLNTLIPTSYRKGGMSIKFVQSSDNKYVQYRLMVDAWSDDTEDWAIANDCVYVGNPEFMYVITDKNKKICWGVRINGDFYFGAGCPQQIKDYVLAHEAEIIAILNDKVDKEEGKSLIDSEVSDILSVVDNPEWTKITLDNKNRIIEGITGNRKKIYIPIDFDTANGNTLNLNQLNLSQQGIEDLKEDLNINPSPINDDRVDVAVGNLTALGTYKSEIEASPLVNNAADAYVGYVTKTPKHKYVQPDLVIGMNHDDLPPSDFIGTRKLYNKFGFNANFNFILQPFRDVSDKEKRIEGIKKLIKDGNTIGLHACMNKAYWILNRWAGFNPSGELMYGPFLNDLKGENPDGTGTNAFGETITADTTFESLGFGDASNKTTKIVEATDNDVLTAIMPYTWYGRKGTTNGLDLTDNIVSKTDIGWMEYWYNNLIDDTLDYSSDESDPLNQFADDYEIPVGADINDYYPDAEHLRTGKIVFFDDTANPHYSDSSYQKVGRFSKGLFKGCASCCNYEVIDRCIDIAMAFVRHYYEHEGFSQMHPHGMSYYTKVVRHNNLMYADSAKKLLYFASAKLFISRQGIYASPYDILVSKGIKCSTVMLPSAFKKYQVLAHADSMYGQNGIKADGFSQAEFVNYLECFGTGYSQNMTYEDFMAFMEGVDNWTKFIFENRGNTLTRNSKTYTVFNFLAGIIDKVRSCVGTGELPLVCVDTIAVNPSTITAIELFMRYCYLNNFKIVPLEEARVASLAEKKVKDNYFPNPSFNQSVLRTIGESEDFMACIPDGWKMAYNDGDVSLEIIDDAIGSGTYKTMKMTTGEGQSCELTTSIYGLPAGEYRLTMFAKKGSNGMYIKVREGKGSTLLNMENTNVVLDERLNDYINEYKEVTYSFTVPEPHRNLSDMSDDVNQACSGYEDNFIKLFIDVYCGANGYLSIGKCSLIKV